MSHAVEAARPAQTSAWHMYRAMVGVGVVCGLLIVGVFQATQPIIERNKAEALRSAIFHVLPAATTSETFRLDDAGTLSEVDGDGAAAQQVFAGYDENHDLVGVAIEAQGMGYQDVIRLIYGYSLAEEAIIGIQVLDSKETPGLGDKIEKDPDFLANFDRLDVALGEDSSTLAHAIVPVRHGEKTQPWEVDGITGATISSEAIANILDESAQYWVPRIQRNVQVLEGDE